MAIEFGAYITVGFQLFIALASNGAIYACIDSLDVVDGLVEPNIYLGGMYVQCFMHQVYRVYQDWAEGSDWHNAVTRVTLRNGFVGGRRRFHVTHTHTDNYRDENDVLVPGYG